MFVSYVSACQGKRVVSIGNAKEAAKAHDGVSGLSRDFYHETARRPADGSVQYGGEDSGPIEEWRVVRRLAASAAHPCRRRATIHIPSNRMD